MNTVHTVKHQSLKAVIKQMGEDQSHSTRTKRQFSFRLVCDTDLLVGEEITTRKRKQHKNILNALSHIDLLSHEWL